MINAYYLIENGLQTGPFSHIDLMDQGMAPDALVLSPVANDWQSASDLPEFHEYFQLKGINLPTVESTANFWWRLLAYLIDYVLLVLFVITLGVVFELISRFLDTAVDWNSDDSDLGLRLVSVVLFITYNAAFEATRMQGSIGKTICKLKVVNAKGGRLRFMNAIGRNAAKLLSGLLLRMGFLNIFMSKRRQGWHDEMAKAYVVRIK
jgi:uncharacterized RDD family membrane protein YckC